MAVELQIIPECFVDTTLVSALLDGIGVNHQKSCNKVVACMTGKFSDSFTVGIIDNDKRRPGYLDQFNRIAYSKHLQLFKHPQRHHYIIIVSPAVEGFIIDCVTISGLSMADYGLPDNLTGLKRITKHIVTSRDTKLINLFQNMSTVGEFKILKNVLMYLMEKRYESDTEELCKFFD